MEDNDVQKCYSESNKSHHEGMLGGAYFLTIVGAAVYFVQLSQTFWQGVVGVLKAFVWPAFVVYKVLEILKL